MRGKVFSAFMLMLTSVVALAVMPAKAQPGVYDTTDDLRRIPIPVVDRSHDPALVITGATLIDGTGKALLANAVVVVRGDRIMEVGRGGEVSPPADTARTIDAKGMYLMPGLIDLHIHLMAQRGNDLAFYSDSDAAAAIRGTALARQLVQAGITAVRDVGTRDDVALRIKEAVHRGIIIGPRVLWAGHFIAIRGGHGDEITSTANGHPHGDGTSPATRVADGPWDWRQAVREQLRAGTDWIKLTAPFTKEEVAAAIDEAHRMGAKVAVDSFGEYTEWAIEAGVDSVEHPLAMTDKAIQLMAKHHTAFVPTLVTFNNLLTTGYPSAGIPAGGFFYTYSRRFPIDHEEQEGRVREAHRLGVRIGVGTDVPFETDTRYPKAYFKELGYLKDAGLSNAEVLAAATRIGADILGMGDKLGTIEKGKIADMILVKSNPLDNLSALQDLGYVIADGKVIEEK